MLTVKNDMATIDHALCYRLFLYMNKQNVTTERMR